MAQNKDINRRQFLKHATGVTAGTGKYSSHPSSAVRSDSIHAVVRGRPPQGPAASGHDERVNKDG